MITVSFSGEADELMEMFTSDTFLSVMANVLSKKIKKEEKPTVEKPKKADTPVEVKTVEVQPSESPVMSPDLVRRAVQEYCVRIAMKNRDKSIAREVGIALIRQCTKGKAESTGNIPEEYRQAVFEAATADIIPDEFVGRV